MIYLGYILIGIFVMGYLRKEIYFENWEFVIFVFLWPFVVMFYLLCLCLILIGKIYFSLRGIL